MLADPLLHRRRRPAGLANGEVQIHPGNGGLQSVWTPIQPNMTPPNVKMLLAGHIHLWEALSFSSDHPAQFVAGFGGTQEETVPLPVTGRVDRCWDVVPACWREHSFIRSLMVLPLAADEIRCPGREKWCGFSWGMTGLRTITTWS